jgi:hypothetical protein
MQINPEEAVEALWRALDWERPEKLTQLFDAVAARLHRHPRFRDMSIIAVDLFLADARREFEHDIDEFEWRLVKAFKDEIGFDGEDVAA